MKKTYLKPTMMVVPLKNTKLLCGSPNVVSNVEFDYGGETPDDFDSDDVR